MNNEESNIIYNPEKLAYYLLINNDNMKNLSAQIFSMETSIYINKKEQLIYKFEILLNISFELIFKYIELLNKMNNTTEDLSKYNINDIENLLKPRLLKISVLTHISEIIEYSKTNNYCRVIIKNLCDYVDNNKFFKKLDCNKKFNFILNSNFNINDVENLKNIYALIEIQNKYYKIYFENINTNV